LIRTIADFSGGFRGGRGPSPIPFSPEIYHLMLVKLKISDPKYIIVLLFLRGRPPLSGAAPPPFFSKFMDPPLDLMRALIPLNRGIELMVILNN
jgi:hypothetical protein